jgi:hypothetical protein
MVEVGPVAHGDHLDAARVGSVPGFGALLAVKALRRGAVSGMMILSPAVPLQPRTSPIRPPGLAL